MTRPDPAIRQLTPVHPLPDPPKLAWYWAAPIAVFALSIYGAWQI